MAASFEKNALKVFYLLFAVIYMFTEIFQKNKYPEIPFDNLFHIIYLMNVSIGICNNNKPKNIYV